MSNNYLIAQKALARGWAVFPCGLDKKPFTPHGFKDATHDQTQVLTWWKDNPQALVGIPCKNNNFWALDLDVKNGVNGIANLQYLAKEQGADNVQAGLAQTTPSGGLHMIFTLGKWDVPQSAGLIAPGIDVRSNGYICTGNLSDGRSYIWNSAEGIEAPLTEAPAWLLGVVGAHKSDIPKTDTVTVKEKQKPQGNINYWLEKYLPQATIGQRNAIGFDLACQCRDAGYSQAKTEALPYPERCPQTTKNKYTRKEWKATVRSAYERIPRNPAKKKDDISFTPEPEVSTIQQETLIRDDPWVPFTLIDAYKDRPPIEYVAEGLFALPSLNILYGSPGCLKSFIMADFALCAAAGIDFLPPAPWQNRSIGIKTMAVKTIWLDFDMGSLRTHERIAALARARSLPGDTPFYYYSMPSPWLDASKKESIGMLTLRAQGMEVKLIIIDNLGTITAGIDENSSAMIAVMSLLRQLSEDTGAAIILVHHQRKGNGITGRAGDSLRGHSSIEAAIDLALQVDRDEDILTIKSTKTRGLDVLPFSAAFTFELKDNGDLNTARFYGLEIEDKSSNAAIIREITTALTGQAMNKTELKNAVKRALAEVGVNRIGNCIDKMAADGKIKTHTGKNNTERIFSL